MRPFFFDPAAKEKIAADILERLKKDLDRFEKTRNETKFTFSYEFGKPATNKVKIIYTPTAYLRMKSLVEKYDGEVAWYGLVDRLDDTSFRVYDVIVNPQYVSAAKVDTDDAETAEFYFNLTEDQNNHMHFQAHSHVKMSTFASGTDSDNQTDIVNTLGYTGFYIFQIWNKMGDINSFVYDLDNNMYYDRKDVDLLIEDPDHGTIDAYAKSTEEMVRPIPAIKYIGGAGTKPPYTPAKPVYPVYDEKNFPELAGAKKNTTDLLENQSANQPAYLPGVVNTDPFVSGRGWNDYQGGYDY